MWTSPEKVDSDLADFLGVQFSFKVIWAHIVQSTVKTFFVIIDFGGIRLFCGQPLPVV